MRNRLFYKLYGVTPLRAHSNPKNKKVAIKSKKNFCCHKKQPYKDNFEFYKALHKKNYGKKPYKKKSYAKSKIGDKDVKCYKCGHFDHYANKCRMQEKTNQLGNLDISEELKESLISTLKNILLNFEEEDNSSSYEEIRQTNSYEESYSDYDECLGIEFCNCNSCNKRINVLTNH